MTGLRLRSLPMGKAGLNPASPIGTSLFVLRQQICETIVPVPAWPGFDE